MEKLSVKTRDILLPEKRIIGTHEHPIILVGEEVRHWLQKNSSGIETS